MSAQKGSPQRVPVPAHPLCKVFFFCFCTLRQGRVRLGVLEFDFSIVGMFVSLM